MPGVTYQSSTLQRPEWLADDLSAMCLIPAGTQAEITAFSYSDAQTLTLAAEVVTAGAGKTLNLVDSLEYPIPAGQILDFGTGEYLTLTTAAEKGDTALVGTLAADTEGGETYDWPGVSGRTVIPSGTLVGRTYAERDAGTGFGIADTATPDDEVFIVAFQNEYAEQDAGITLVRHDALIYENKLPGWDGFDAAAKALVRSLYNCLSYPS